MTRSLIEQWLPAPTIGAESLRESAASSALPPTKYLHVWWARRPLTASRAAVVASLLPAWPTAAEAASDPAAEAVLAGLKSEFPRGEGEYHAWFLWSMGITGDPVAGRRAIQRAVADGTKTRTNVYGYPRAFTVSPEAETVKRIHRLAALRADLSGSPIVLDPFAGGGSIPFEAARYGCTAIAGELNPVATAILEGTVALPRELGPDFADELNRRGRRWADRVRRRLDAFFPLVELDERLAYIWAHTVPCPTTGQPTPLAPDFWLARGNSGREVAVRLEVDQSSGHYTVEIVEGKEAATFGRRVTYKDGTATSIWTGETFSGEYIRARAAEGRVGAMLLAVSVTRPGSWLVSGLPGRSPTSSPTSRSLPAKKQRGAWR